MYYVTKHRYIIISTEVLFSGQQDMNSTIDEKIFEIARKNGVIRPRELQVQGISRQHLYHLYRKGLLNRVGRGLYVPIDTGATENRTIAEVCKRVPGGVICLLSALQLHGLTTQMPFEVWIAIDQKAWRPIEHQLPIRIVYFSSSALESGIEERRIEGVPVKVYNPAKTIADCFKFRNKIGLDVAIEALQDCRRQRVCTNDDLWRYAKICRVWNVMKPYLEALL